MTFQGVGGSRPPVPFMDLPMAYLISSVYGHFALALSLYSASYEILTFFLALDQEAGIKMSHTNKLSGKVAIVTASTDG